MLSYISQKFSKPTRSITHEPRAALFLNRFSRTLTIMYATNGLADIIGIPANELCGKSFYYCIQENCLRDAVKCLESAKANDSIAYLRFWFRDPRQDNQAEHDEHMSDGHSSGDEDDGGVHLSELMDHDRSENAVYSDSSNSLRSSVERDHAQSHSMDPESRTSSGNSTDLGANNEEAIFDRPEGPQQSRTSSISSPDEHSNASWPQEPSRIELEAVVSCTSDGLVVILRRARPVSCHMPQPLGAAQHPFANGYFASPWASDPILPSSQDRSHYSLPHLQQPSQAPAHPTAARANVAASNGPATEDFMNSIREVAVFAWALTGINGSLEQFGRGTPSGESQPPGGLPIWDPHADAGLEIDRPIGGAYLTNGQHYGATHQRQERSGLDPASHSHSNGQDERNGYMDRKVSDSTHIHDQHIYSNGLGSNGHHNGLPSNGQEGGMQVDRYDGYIQANGFHNPLSPNNPWTKQPEHPQVWDMSEQRQQEINHMDRRNGNGRGFG